MGYKIKAQSEVDIMEPNCSCKKDSSVTMILMGTQKIGLIGLNSLFEEWGSAGKAPDTLRGEEILTSIKKKNYVSTTSEQEYIKAVRSAYVAYCKRRV
ncbi:MAG: hypothetical protein HXS48_24855 [Theionarchaea archaeon]|nr:hypothetical protein [Theionarchaea archaeon]